MNVQITLILCAECNESRDEIALVRKSHSSSYWCEHAAAAGKDWGPGRQRPRVIAMVKT